MRVISIIFLLFVILCSCKKHGCKAVNALNYNPNAKKKDQSCIFESKGILYWNNDGLINMENDSITHVTVEFDHEVLIENSPITNYDVNSIMCESQDWFYFEKIIYDPTMFVSLKILNQNDSLVYAEAVEIQYGCHEYLIDY